MATRENQPWELCQGFIYAAAEELKQLTAMGVFTREGATVKDCWALGTTPLRPSEVPTLKVTPSGNLDKCKWRVAVDGSDEKEGVHFLGSSHHCMLRQVQSPSATGSRPKPKYLKKNNVDKQTSHLPTTFPRLVSTAKAIRSRSTFV